MANWTMTFEGYTLTIDGMQNERELKPAPEPFSTRGDNDNDFFRTLRTSTGTVRFICKADDVEELANSEVGDHQVILTDSSENRMWTGYVKQDVFTQPYQTGLMQIEIPVCDMLEASSGMFPVSCLKTPTIGELLYEWVSQMQMLLYTRNVYITARTPVSRLGNRIQFRSLFWDEEKKECRYSWAEILTEVCNAYGWQMQMDMGSIWLFSRDSDDGKMNHLYLYQLMQANPTAEEYMPPTIPVISLSGALLQDHKVSVYQGKSKVKVTGDGGETSRKLFDLNVGGLIPTFRGYMDASSSIYDIDYKSIDSRHLTLSNTPVEAGSEAARYGIFQARYYQAWGGGHPSGEKPASEYSGANFGMVSKKQGWMQTQLPSEEWRQVKGLFLSPGAAQSIVASIKTDVIDTSDGRSYISIAGTVKMVGKNNIGTLLNGDAPRTAGYIRCYIRYAGKYLSHNTVTHELSWVSETTAVQLTFNEDGRILFPHPYGEPRQSPEIAYPDNAFFFLPGGQSSQLQIDMFNNMMDFYIVEDLSVSLERAVRRSEEKNVNTATRQMSNGAKEEYSVECMLTTAEPNQGGAGVILGNDYSATQSLEESGKSSVDSFADRIAAYYGDSYMVYELGIKNYLPIQARVAFGDKLFACVANAFDWMKQKNKLTLIQIK